MKILKIDVQDGLTGIEVALHSRTEADRLTSFLEEAAVALAAVSDIKQQDIELVYQYLTQYGFWESCSSEQYSRNNKYGRKTRILCTRPEGLSKETK